MLKRFLYSCLLAATMCRAQTTPLVVATTVSCATSVDGSVVGLPNPQTPPNVVAQYTGTLPAGNYYTEIGWYDAAGHVTLVGPEVQTQLTAQGELQVGLPDAGMPAAAIGMNVYIGAASGAETLQGQTTGSATFTQSTSLTTGVAVPTTNTTVCAVVANDAGWPTGTSYTVDMTSSAGGEVPGFPQQSQLLGPGQKINVGQGFPPSSGQVIYPVPVVARPYNHAAQSISGPLSMTGYKLTQVGSLGVGTQVPGWPIDVENGAINASGGYIYNGGAGVATGNCLVAGSDPYKTFGPGTCASFPAIYYQNVTFAGVVTAQQPTLNFTSRFTGSVSVTPPNTTVDVNGPGSGIYVATYATVPGSSTNMVFLDGSGNLTASPPVTCTNTGTSGCFALPQGFYEEWVMGTTATTTCFPNNQSEGSVSNQATLTWPHAFAHAVLSTQVTTQQAGNNSTQQDVMWQLSGNPTTTQVTVIMQKMSSSEDGTVTCPIVWALGN